MKKEKEPFCRRLAPFGLALVVALLLTVMGFMAQPARAQTTAPDATPEKWVVLAWNDLGMHCYNRDFQHIAVLPPYNTVWAQVIKVGNPPKIVTDTVKINYFFPDNTYSVGKSNFWTYSKQLFGVDLPPNIGLTGKGLAGDMDVVGDHFSADGIPITEFSDSNLTVPDPYQLATIVVKDRATGNVLTQARTVAPVSTEMHCEFCHADGGVEGVRTGNVETNILTLHDKENAGEYPAGHAPLMNSQPVLCAECHASNALGAPGKPGIPNLSKAMHSKHAGAVSSGSLGVAGQPLAENECYNCHPGPSTKCLRDVMSARGMTCTDCHGSMEEVAANPNPWLNEPRCDSCHTDPQFKQDQPLFRFSTGHGGVRCEGCHDSTHAVAPSTQPKDAIKFIDLQGHAGTLDTCTVCHLTDPTGPGPHGILAPSVAPTATVTPLPTGTPPTPVTPTPTATPVPGNVPVLRSVQPSRGSNDSPNELILSGANFRQGITAAVGAQTLIKVERDSSTKLKGILPAGLPVGVYTVTVRNPDGGTAALANGYTSYDRKSNDFFATANDLWTDPLTVRAGSTARLGLTVHRSGGQSYQQVTVAFFYRLPDNKLKEIGRVLVEPMLPDTTRPVSVTWNTAGLAGAVTVVAVIDPEQKVTESTENNNSVSRTVTLVAATGDSAAPTIQSLTVNGGAAETTNPAVYVNIGASDSGGSGLATVYLAERQYNTVAGEWITIQSTGWIGWQDSIPFMLSGHGGTRYIQVWVADSAGNIAQGRVRIDYLPASDSVLQNQVHVYRRTLGAGQTLNVTLQTVSGDADLYVWGPDRKRVSKSTLDGAVADRAAVVAPKAGEYQIEVVGQAESVFQLVFDMNGAAISAPQEIVGSTKPERTQPVVAPTGAPDDQFALPDALIGAPPPASSLKLFLQQLVQ